MSTQATDAAREERIQMEIVVDAYGPDEQASGWYCYLEDTLQFPFEARCATERATSPLRAGETVEVLGMASDEVCDHEMFVMVAWQGRELAVPLAQITASDIDDETRQAIEDWHYWVERGYEF